VQHKQQLTAAILCTRVKAWKFIASFRSPKDGENLHHLYSFLEDFGGANGQQYRKAFYNNAWVQDEDAQWIELNKLTFHATQQAKLQTVLILAVVLKMISFICGMVVSARQTQNMATR